MASSLAATEVFAGAGHPWVRHVACFAEAVQRICATLSLALVTLGAAVPHAQAAGIFCYDGQFFPRDGARVPANLPVILYWPSADAISGTPTIEAATADLMFVELNGDGSSSPVAHTLEGEAPPFRIVPTAGFEAGKTYALWTRQCSETAPSAEHPAPWEPSFIGAGDETPIPYATIEVTESAPFPTELPALRAEAPVNESIEYHGDCSGCGGPYDAVSVYVELDGELGPWRDALAFSTMVDDTSYIPSPYYKFPTLYGKSWVGHGRDRISMICDETTNSLSEGTHRVRMEATIPGTDVMLVSNTAEVDLVACPSSVSVDDAPDASTLLPDAGGQPPPARDDASGPDGSVADSDERAEPATTDRKSAKRAGGCSVQGNVRGRVGVHWLLALMGLILLRRRRA